MTTALIVLASGFEEIEAVTPIDVLRRAGVEVIVAGLSEKIVVGARGITLVADCLLEDYTNHFDALILPGGLGGAKLLALSDKVIEMVNTAMSENKIVASICASPALVLFKAGVLKGKNVTCYPGFESNFDDSVNFHDESVVIDGNLITSKGPGSAFEFSLALVEYLTDKDTKNMIKNQTVVKSV